MTQSPIKILRNASEACYREGSLLNMHLCIEGIRTILEHGWKRYNDAKVDDAGKLSYLQLVKECNEFTLT
jgi:hypothetical protein